MHHQESHLFPGHLYELAARAGVGTPLERIHSKSMYILLAVEVFFALALLGWIGETIYEWLAFLSLSKMYPHITAVPDYLFNTYSWYGASYDNRWRFILTTIPLTLGFLLQWLPHWPAYQIRLYLCTDGLLKVDKKKIEAVRWDEIEEMSRSHGRVTQIKKQDGTTIVFPARLLGGQTNRFNAIIVEQVTHHLHPAVETRFSSQVLPLQS
jgi:hypothetical protein